ncbi:lymphocyte antigen 75 isoform X2 [Xenopus laevis]|uniref:Lymphocyte antigen 75 isoform X2 n=1 Tax=Xenopus laevis TaxID=8355 RepID=A0A8J1LVR6_XENLA|nr:lymphocyte antigen 75 isoform X2 [Xenopus laevis]
MGSQGVPQLWLLTVWTALYITASFGAKDHAFTILHEQSMKCLQYDNSRISTVNCSAENEALLWKWVSSHRLFHLRSQMCLGIDLTSPQDPLKMVPCNSHLMLWWRCHDGSIYGASKYRLTEKGGTVTASFSSNDTWIRDNTPESVCELPYHVIYTREGNSNGVACEFPFLRNGTWHHDCIKEVNGTKEWCATTSNYDTERKWGFCLKPVNGCGESWTENLQSCYQFNMDSSLTWKEAYISCQNQGADLLSISSPDELKEIAQTKNLTDLVWIGLNRLDTSGGWQWSDNTPLSFITWDKDISEFSVLDGLSCGALDGNTGSWRNYNCERSFPYICEKTRETKTQTPDSWFFTKTDCELHWMPHNGFCYMLEQPSLWDNATEFCRHRGAELMSIHSLADIEMVVTSFQAENDIWSGLKNDEMPALFKWSDGTETDFTYWDRNEPNVNVIMAPNCVSFSGKSGRWNVRSCNENLKYICKKKGTVNNETKVDVDCQQDQGWRRHGHFCYMVDMNEVLFGPESNLTVTNKFEQEFLNSLILEQSKTEGKYFWTSLRDVNYTGDYWWETPNGTMDMTYANWNTLQPAFPGGCVAMASGPSIGKWEVKDCNTFKAKSIRKKRIGSSEPEEPVLPTPKGQCPDGWHPTQRYCYKLFHYERLLRTRTWEEAEGFCEELGGHLVSFTHNDEQEELYMYLKSVISNVRWLWSGLNKRDPGLHGSWQWSDERPVSSVYVPSNSQEDDYDLRDCVAFRFNKLDPFPLEHWEGPWGMPLRRPWRLWHKPEVLISLKPFHCEASLEWMCQVAKGEFKKPAWYQPDNSSSANSLIVDSDEFWFVSDKQLTYSEAALYCAAMDSDLASVKSPHALRTIQNHLKKAQNFTALTKWWLKSINYGDTFQTHGPHYYLRGFRHCMEISGYFWFTGYGRENNCNERQPFICQKQNLTLLEKDSQKPTQFKGECPKNWTSFGDKCFLILPKPKYLSFQKAEEECSTYGGVLPVIANQLQQDYITTLLPKLQSKLWIGLTSVNQSIPKWVDGRSYLYENFHPLLMARMRSNPVNLFFDADSHCFFIQNDPRLAAFGTWDITSCDDQQFVSICQKDKAMNGNNTQSISSEDLEFKDHKYKIIQRNVTWYSALLECNNHSMELASITEKYQLAYLSVQVSSLDHPMWIGLTSSNDGVNYQWQDGKQVVLSKWSEDEEEEEQCVYIDTDGFWKTMSCDAELPGAFCHFVKDPKKKQLDNTQACPHKIGEKPWIPFRNNCYTFILKHDRWNQNKNEDERFHCKMLNPDSNILSIKDEDEKEFILKELIPYSDYVQWVLLGMHYNAIERKFQWDDKTFVTYSNWRWGREATNHSFLAVMASDGYWDILKLNMGDLFFFKHKTALVCKLELDRLDNTSYQAPSMSYQNTQYHIIEKKVNWHEAIKECRKMGSHLASVHSADQEDFLQEIVKHDGFPLWIGLSSQEVDTSSYEWSDGNSYDYFPVGYEVPRIIGNCGFLDTKGFWNLKNCMEPLNGAICYSSSTMKSKADYALCSDTPGEGVWVRKNNFCYGFDESLYNYSVFSSERASSICHNLDPTSEVLSITDVEENEFVSQYLKANAFITNKVWLGLDPLSFSKELKWLDGTSIQYTNWGIEDETAKYHCAIFYPETGVWHKVSCVPGHARVVCKAPLKSVKTGAAIGFAVLIIVLLLIGLVVYFYKTQRPYFSSTVRYQRTDDETETMVVNSLD